jgi:hypothetical protein
MVHLVLQDITLEVKNQSPPPGIELAIEPGSEWSPSDLGNHLTSAAIIPIFRQLTK